MKEESLFSPRVSGRFLFGGVNVVSENIFKKNVTKITVAGVLAAMGVILAMLRFPIFPAVPFYEMEFSDFPVLISTFLCGPVYGLCTLTVVCLIQALTVSASSGIIGFIMHLAASGCMILAVYFIKKAFKSKGGVVVSAVSGALVMTLVMIPMNIWLTTVFMNLPPKEFMSAYLIYCVIFNLIKSISNIVIFYLILPLINKQIKHK